jgi:hypothetical protein
MFELRNPDDARAFVLQGLHLQRLVPPSPQTVRPILEWALEIASGGQPLPALGFVADVGHAVFGLERVPGRRRQDSAARGLAPGLVRAYEDHVLGKILTDAAFQRGSDALRHYQGRNQARGLAFVIEHLRQRTPFVGVHLSPAVLKSLLRDTPAQVLAAGAQSLERGPWPGWPELYESITAALRRAAELLGPEDLFELEHKTALEDLGQRLALRQVIQAAELLAKMLPAHRPAPRPGRREVPTRFLAEDTYPVGGFTALATRGSIESLLWSQLAFMEPENRPDLFDVKYVRDELLYYARDENLFLRRRQTIVFALGPDLVRARFKDQELPYQRIILLLGWVLTAVRRLIDWLSSDALTIVIALIDEPGAKSGALAAERGLLEMILREPIAKGTLTVERLPGWPALQHLCVERAQRSVCRCLSATTGRQALQMEEDVDVLRLQMAAARPVLYGLEGADQEEPSDVALETWGATLGRALLRLAGGA